jgi:hypothetical protein
VGTWRLRNIAATAGLGGLSWLTRSTRLSWFAAMAAGRPSPTFTGFGVLRAVPVGRVPPWWRALVVLAAAVLAAAVVPSPLVTVIAARAMLAVLGVVVLGVIAARILFAAAIFRPSATLAVRVLAVQDLARPLVRAARRLALVAVPRIARTTAVVSATLLAGAGSGDRDSHPAGTPDQQTAGDHSADRRDPHPRPVHTHPVFVMARTQSSAPMVSPIVAYPQVRIWRADVGARVGARLAGAAARPPRNATP